MREYNLDKANEFFDDDVLELKRIPSNVLVGCLIKYPEMLRFRLISKNYNHIFRHFLTEDFSIQDSWY